MNPTTQQFRRTQARSATIIGLIALTALGFSVITACSSGGTTVTTARATGAAQPSSTVASPVATSSPSPTPTPSPIPALFTGTASYTDESGYTYNITYALQAVGALVISITNSLPGQNELNEAVTGILAITNTTTGRTAQLAGNLNNVTLAALYKPTRPICAARNQSPGFQPRQVKTHDARDNDPTTYCLVDLYDGTTGYAINSLPSGQSFTYTQRTIAAGTPVADAIVFQSLATTNVPAIQADLATPPDANLLYTGQWTGDDTTQTPTTPQCGTYLPASHDNISILAASVAKVC